MANEYVKSVFWGPCVFGVDKKSIEFALATPQAAAASDVVSNILRSVVIFLY